MSYDVMFINENNETVQLDPNIEVPTGGTYGVGLSDAALNITWNYCNIYRDYGFTFKEEKDIKDNQFIAGKTAKECRKILRSVIENMPPEIPDDDYWAPTIGNARKALVDLLFIADNVPDESIVKLC